MNDIPLIDDTSDHETTKDPIQIPDGDSEDEDTAETRRLEEEASQDEKKKAGLSTVYDGFQIYGRILCLVVKRKDNTKGQHFFGGGQAMVEGWISSTQENEDGRFE